MLLIQVKLKSGKVIFAYFKLGRGIRGNDQHFTVSRGRCRTERFGLSALQLDAERVAVLIMLDLGFLVHPETADHLHSSHLLSSKFTGSAPRPPQQPETCTSPSMEPP